MQVLKNSGIAVGIEWTLHESLAQAKKAVSGKKKILVARKIISGECVQGVCPLPAKPKKLHAGALMAAAVANDVLIYHRLDNDQAWVCAVREGIPLHGFDVVADEESAKVTLAEVMSYVPTADIYGDIPGAKGSLDELFAQLSPKDKKAVALNPPSSPVALLLLLVVFLLLAAVVVVGYPLLKNALSGPAKLQLQSEEELKKARLLFEAQVAEQRRTFWHARSPAQQFVLWYDVLRTLPVAVEGWKPGVFRCDPEACQVTWKREAQALYSPAVRLPGKGGELPFNPALMEMTTTFPLNKTEAVPHVLGVGATDKYLLDLSVNKNPFTLTLDASQSPVTVSPSPGVQGLAPVTIGREGKWRLAGGNPLLLPEFLGKVTLPGVVLSTLSIKSLNLGRPQYLIELEGRYRVGN